jgi:hypothetical protein
LAWLKTGSLFLATLCLAACATAPEPTATAVPSLAATSTTAPSATSIPEITATPAIASGIINVAMASCRVGPGGGYMQRTTLYEGNAVEVLGQMDLNANWLLLRTTSFNCWMSVNLVSIDGDVETLPTISDPHTVLPLSSYYGPVDDVSTVRQGDLVTVRWGPFEPRADDVGEGVPYVVEAWVCQGGQFVFRAYAAQERKAQIVDERNTCAERSHARIIASEKRGYTPPREIPWP